MTTFDRYLALIGAYLIATVAIIAVVIIRGPVRDAAWEEPCRALRAGEAIPGHWNTTTPCNRRPS